MLGLDVFRDESRRYDYSTQGNDKAKNLGNAAVKSTPGSPTPLRAVPSSSINLLEVTLRFVPETGQDPAGSSPEKPTPRAAPAFSVPGLLPRNLILPFCAAFAFTC